MTQAPVPQLQPSQAWVASLSADHHHNWVICREAGLWGTPNNAGRSIQTGDELFVWQSQAGWLARSIVLRTYPVDDDNPAPWTDGADYRWLFDISVVAEADPPVWLPSPGGWQDQTGLHTSTFRALSRIDATQANAVRALFPTSPALQTATRVRASEPSTGWGRGADRARNKLIEQAGINTTIKHYETQGYTLTGDRQLDGVGYDLEFTDAAGHTLHVEAKGIAGSQLAFNLTAKELDMATTDPDFRLCAVTQALGTPTLHELTGQQLQNLRITPTQYRASSPAPVSTWTQHAGGS